LESPTRYELQDIDFETIPFQFLEKMSVLIGMKTDSPSIYLSSKDLNGFGFEKVKSFDLD
jgi:hypothetical protein